MDSITLNAYAKINPALDVVGVRPDGYHEVRMLLQQIELHDVITLTKSAQPGVRLSVTYAAQEKSDCIGDTNPSVTRRVTVFAPLRSASNGRPQDVRRPLLGEPNDSGSVPSDASNLACRAAQRLIDACGIREGVDIALEKHIPAAAGLAGGSTDAAAVLKGMNTLFGLGLSEAELRAHGLALGADVPFCILGGCALAEGIGERLTPQSPIPPCRILLVKPPVGVSTGAVYHALDAVADFVRHDSDADIDAGITVGTHSDADAAAGSRHYDIDAADAGAHSDADGASGITHADIDAAAAGAHSDADATAGITHADIDAAAAGTYSDANAAAGITHPDIDAAIAACAAGDLAALCRCMGNILETVTVPLLPRLSAIRTALLNAGAEGAMMSGSGPTMFGLFSDPDAADAAKMSLSKAFPDCRIILTRPIG